MDSRLIAGAYSQQFHVMDMEVSLLDNTRLDAVARAKRLSQETNRRRKLQALKRKLEAKREERRRNNILTKRREEQRLATEKYQRAHLPPSARQGFGSSSRRLDGAALENALWLVRGSPQNLRAVSSHERIHSYSKENENPLEMSFNRTWPHSTQLGLSRSAHHLDPKERAELMDHSLQNVTSSKSLFEQQLEHQQSLILKQQQQSMREFSEALHSEIDRNKIINITNDVSFADQGGQGDITNSDSCSSLDSLNDSGGTNIENGRHTLAESRQRPVNAHHDHGEGQDITEDRVTSKQGKFNHLQQGIFTNPGPPSKQMFTNYHENQKTAMYGVLQKQGPLSNISKTETETKLKGLSKGDTRLQQQNSFTGLTDDNEVLQKHYAEGNGIKNASSEEKRLTSLKQFSTDSLESCSSSSSVHELKLQSGTGETSKVDHFKQPLDTESRSKSSNPSLVDHIDTVSEHNAQMLRQQVFDDNSLEQQSPALTAAITTSIPTQTSQMAWISPATQTDTTPNKNDIFQPRYTTGAAMWTDYNVHGLLPTSVMSTLSANSHPQNSKSTLTSQNTVTTFPSFLPTTVVKTATLVSASSKVDSAGTVESADNKISTFSAPNSEMSSKFSKRYNSTHLQSHDLGNNNSNSNQKKVHFSSTYEGHPQYQGKVQSTQAMQEGTDSIYAPTKKSDIQVSAVQQCLPNRHLKPTYNHQRDEDPGFFSLGQQSYHHYQNQQQNGFIPASYGYGPDTESSFPASRPPTPVLESTAGFEPPAAIAARTEFQPYNSVSRNGASKITTAPTSSNKGLKDQMNNNAKDYEEEDEGPDETKPLKGILKQNTLKLTTQGQDKATVGKAKPRDSLEIAHLHNDKKTKKKSVRFAGHHDEEYENDSDEVEHDGKMGIIVTNDGTPIYKNAFIRPSSAKVVSVTTRYETGQKMQRATSAGPYRQQAAMPEHVQIRNVQQMSSNSATANSTFDGTNAATNNILSPRSNLPSSFVNPLATTPIHRPKAAAHIIMSTDVPQVLKESPVGNGANHAGPVTAHKAQLESKIRSVNNNFMSKVPVKVPTTAESNAAIYNVGYAQVERNLNTNVNTFGTSAGESIQQVVKESQHQPTPDKAKSANSGHKRISFGNPIIPKANLLPASTKVTFPYSNGGTPSLTSNAIFNETGMRIDRTPTDDEITWLWDKVRNCLNKEGGIKNQVYVNGGSDLAQRQPPLLSTKLIDGASLGLGMYHGDANSGVDGLKSGSAFFYPRTTPNSNGQSKARLVVQQQGSYLRRYGLLKQRRVNSASAAMSKPGHDGGRSSSAVYGLNSTVHPHQSSAMTGQQHQQDLPTPLAHAYKPQDEVSESTAAFIMAERLAKQSLSDSHIQMAMEDAQSKQEAYNRSKMTVTKDKHSALSFEEQKLMESLDRLNERLKEPTFKASVYYHQASQPQMSGFQGRKPIIDMRRHMLLSPRTPHRAQSARIRQQLYQNR